MPFHYAQSILRSMLSLKAMTRLMLNVSQWSTRPLAMVRLRVQLRMTELVRPTAVVVEEMVYKAVDDCFRQVSTRR